MDIRDTMAYKYYSIYRAKNEKNENDYVNNKISRELLNKLGRKTDVEFIENLKKVPENEKRLSIKTTALEHIKEQEEFKKWTISKHYIKY